MKAEDKKPAPKKIDPGKVFDVSRPGKSPAPPTSRPVIMGHKPEAQAAQTAVSGIGEASPLLTKRKIQVLPPDGSQPAETPAPSEAAPEDLPAGAPSPTPAESERGTLGAAAVDTASGPPALPPEKDTAVEPVPEAAVAEKAKLVIAPPTAAEPAAEEPEAAVPAPEPETPAPEAPAEEPAPATPAAEPAATPDIPTSTSSSVPDSPPEETALPADPLKPEEAPPYPKIDPLFDESGHIVVSHHNHHQRHALKVLGLLLLIVLLAAVAVDLLLDLDLLNLEGLPHTNFL